MLKEDYLAVLHTQLAKKTLATVQTRKNLAEELNISVEVVDYWKQHQLWHQRGSCTTKSSLGKHIKITVDCYSSFYTTVEMLSLNHCAVGD